jgi:hypothetical protein
MLATHAMAIRSLDGRGLATRVAFLSRRREPGFEIQASQDWDQRGKQHARLAESSLTGVQAANGVLGSLSAFALGPGRGSSYAGVWHSVQEP